MSSTGIVKVFRRILFNRLPSPKYAITREKSSLWTPDYLEEAKSKFPEYPITNIQIKGYDFVILERYQRKIHWICKKLDLDVTDSWANECQKLKIARYKKNSSVPEVTYDLKCYERNIQVSDVYIYQMGTLVDLVISTCPAGVTVRFHPHQESHFEDRFVPELRLFELKQMLNDLENEK